MKQINRYVSDRVGNERSDFKAKVSRINCTKSNPRYNSGLIFSVQIIGKSDVEVRHAPLETFADSLFLLHKRGLERSDAHLELAALLVSHHNVLPL